MPYKKPMGYYEAITAPYKEAQQNFVNSLLSAGPRNVAVAPNVYVNPDYYETGLGRAELERNYQIEQEHQLRDARVAFQRLPQLVQSGAHSLTAEERQQNQGISEAGLRAINAIEPLVKSGVVDPRQVGSLLTREISASFETQERQRKISREINAIKQQHRAGRLTSDALDDATSSMYSSYGNALLSNPDFAELTGLKQQREAEIAQRVFDAEKEHGVKMEWDDRQNRTVLDRDVVAIEQYKSELQGAAATRKFRETQNAIKDRDVTLKHKVQRLSLWEQATAASEEETGQVNHPYRNRMALMRKEIDRLLGTEVPQFSGPANMPVTTYPNQAALEAAWEAGTAKPGFITIGGTPAVLTADGQVNGR